MAACAALENRQVQQATLQLQVMLQHSLCCVLFSALPPLPCALQFELMVTYFTPTSSASGSAAAAAGQAQLSSFSPRNSLSSGQVQQYAMAEFRCAATTGLDQHMPLIGIPNFLPNTAEGNRAFYFVALKPVVPQLTSSNRANSTGSENSSGTAAAAAGSGASVGNAAAAAAARRPVRKMASFSLMTPDGPFQDIKLGPLLGKGAFGRVYRGAKGTQLRYVTLCIRGEVALPAVMWLTQIPSC
jgi:hypothetical protein